MTTMAPLTSARGRRRRRRTQDSRGPATPTSTAARRLDRELPPFLHLLGSLIAEHIVADPSTCMAGKVDVPPSLESMVTLPQEDPGHSGPIPIVPPDSQRPSHSSPKKSRKPPRRS